MNAPRRHTQERIRGSFPRTLSQITISDYLENYTDTFSNQTRNKIQRRILRATYFCFCNINCVIPSDNEQTIIGTNNNIVCCMYLGFEGGLGEDWY